MDKANRFNAHIVTFSVVTDDLAASLSFYEKVLGWKTTETAVVSLDLPRLGLTRGLRSVSVGALDGQGARIRLIEVPQGASSVRPQPETLPWVPGLEAMELQSQDIAKSYHAFASAGVHVVSSPQYYFYRHIPPLPDFQVMSFLATGPSSERLYVSGLLDDPPIPWSYGPGLHGPPIAAIVTDEPSGIMEPFYAQALGLSRTSRMACRSVNVNRLCGLPPQSIFNWGFLGPRGVQIEIRQYADTPSNAPSRAMFSELGLAMFTLAVENFDGCRSACAARKMDILSATAFPESTGESVGFMIRGPVGELIEVVPRVGR